MEKNLNTENKTRQKIKSFLAMNGYTLKEVVEKMNTNHPDTPTTAQNITNKLARETIKFSEVVENCRTFRIFRRIHSSQSEGVLSCQ